MADDNKTVVRRIINDVINTGNLAQADALFAPNYVYHGAGGLELRGPEGFKQLIHTYRGAFPDMRLTIDDLISEDDKVVVRWTARGTHRGELTGIAPTGKAVTISGIIVSRLSDGKVVEEFETFDEVSLLRQLGVSTLPAVAATI
jgi:steroid delta-isomerase-like uncharacterized protein